MGRSFAFAGDKAVGGIVASALQAAGLSLAPGVHSADYVVSYCLAQSQLEDVYLGTGGIIESAGEGCFLVDLSPSTTTLAKELYALARVNEMQFLDAPMVLKDPCAHDAFGDPGNVMLLVGGEDDAFAHALPVLDALADDVRRVGDAGAGQLAKAMCTVQQASALVSLVESFALAKSHDVDGRAALSASIAAGLVPEGALTLYEAMRQRHFHGTYSCAVLMAELTAVLEAAEEIDLALPQAEACERLMELFLVVGGSDLPLPALSLVYASQEEASSHGIDWSRAEGIYSHDHAGDSDSPEDGYPDDGDLDGYGDEGGYAAGFAGFSAN